MTAITGIYNGKQCILFIFILLILSHGNIVTAENAGSARIPDQQQIEVEINTFQKFFRKRFPIIDFQAFNQGAYALPQFYRFKTNRDLLNIIPPYTHDMTGAEHFWKKKENNQHTLLECMARYPGAHVFPYFYAGTVLTIERAIRQCFQSDITAPAYGSDELSVLVAGYRARYKNIPLKIDYSEPGMRAIYQKGRDLFWSRRGQNNFSCASCHVHNSGNQIRNSVIPAALGQSTLLPVYNPRLAHEGQNWVNLHEQYSRCYLRSGAAPMSQQSEEYIALELYQAIMDSGMPLNAPGFRP